MQSLRDDPATHRGYSAICTARAALSSFLDKSLVDNKFVKQFLRGVYNQNPPKTRYAHIWDPRTVLDVLSGPSWTPASQLDLLQLTKKTVFLILITSGQRGQIIPALSLENMEEQEDGFVFKIDNKFLKQGRPGYRPGLLRLLSYEDRSICVATYLKEYLARTNDLRENTDKVFLTTRKPYKPVSRDTVSRWVKSLLQAAGIDTTEFGAGSTRSAASSKASSEGVPLDQILEAAGWSQETTFTKWYNKSINGTSNGMAKSILGS